MFYVILEVTVAISEFATFFSEDITRNIHLTHYSSRKWQDSDEKLTASCSKLSHLLKTHYLPFLWSNGLTFVVVQAFLQI